MSKLRKFKQLKETPGFPAGSIYTQVKTTNIFMCTSETKCTSSTTLEHLLKYPEWFEEIIEQPKFIKGRWYKGSAGNNTWYMCYEKTLHDQHWYNKNVSLFNGEFVEIKQNDWCRTNVTYTEVPYSEVEPYLKPKLMFGDKEVKIVKGKTESTTYIQCADFETDLSHLKILYNSLSNLENWNTRIGHKVKEINDIELPITSIKIGCQTGEISEIKEIIKQAENLLRS